MEKKIVLTLLILYWLGMHSQVEINTSGPETTLNIGRNSMRATVLDGIITGAQLKTKKYNSAKREVFVTDADTAFSGQTLNITSSDYFFFDDQVGAKLNNRDFNITKDILTNNPSNARVGSRTNFNGSTFRTAGSEFVVQRNVL